jgi:hypothetical protein
MLRRAALAGALIASVACDRSQGGDSAGSPPVASAGSAKAASPGGSFSADLAKELAGPDKGSAGAGSAGAGRSGDGAPSDPKAGGGASTTAAGGDKTGGDKIGGDKAGGGAPTTAQVGGAQVGGDKAGGDKAGGAPTTAAGDDKAGGAKAGGGASTTAQAGGAKAAGDKSGGGAPTTAASGDKAGGGAPSMGGGDKAGGAKAASAGAAEPAADVGAPARGPVKVPADLAAIKLSLLPNWDRDIGQAGTFQYVVRIKGTQNTKTFTFHYGYDDPKAPRDHEQYKKYLQDTRALSGEIRDRQRGAAWFLEGSDASGSPAFRYVVLYGGKQLICYGSLYKDAESSRLGDDRDQTLIQAKQICETLAL